MEWISLITLVGNVIIPPAFSFIKSIFGIKDTPQDTLSTLSMSKPEVVPNFIDAQGRLLEAETKYFQRDVSGTPSQWVIDLRASIRPLSVVLSFALLFISIWESIPLPALVTSSGVIGNWIGTKIEFHN